METDGRGWVGRAAHVKSRAGLLPVSSPYKRWSLSFFHFFALVRWPQEVESLLFLYRCCVDIWWVALCVLTFLLARAFYLQEPFTYKSILLTRAFAYICTCFTFQLLQQRGLERVGVTLSLPLLSTQAIRPVLAMTLRDLAWLALRHDVAQSSPCRSLSHALTGPGESIRWWGGRNDIEPCHGCMHRFFSTARL